MRTTLDNPQQRHNGVEHVQEPMYDSSSTPGGVWCPACGHIMRIRLARSGSNAGRGFWGCASYPACTGTRPLFDLLDAATFEWHAVMIADLGRPAIPGSMLTVRDSHQLIHRLCAVKSIALVDDPAAAEALRRISALQGLPGLIARAACASHRLLRRSWPLACITEALDATDRDPAPVSFIDPWLVETSSLAPASHAAPPVPAWAVAPEPVRRQPAGAMGIDVRDLEDLLPEEDDVEPVDYRELTRTFGNPHWFDEPGRPPSRHVAGTIPGRRVDPLWT